MGWIWTTFGLTLTLAGSALIATVFAVDAPSTTAFLTGQAAGTLLGLGLVMLFYAWKCRR